jgi:hypothetical protein
MLPSFAYLAFSALLGCWSGAAAARSLRTSNSLFCGISSLFFAGNGPARWFVPPIVPSSQRSRGSFPRHSGGG